MHSQWQEVFDIDRLKFIDPEEYARLESERGEPLIVYTNVDRMEAELLKHAPEDEAEIHHFASAVRRLAKFPLTDFAAPWPRNWLAALRIAPDLPLLRHWSGMTVKEYAARFKHVLLRRFFGGGEPADLSMLPLIFSLAWMNSHNAGYPTGGSQAVIRPIVENLLNLGGQLRLDAQVEKILVEHSAAVGVELAGGETVGADWVTSAADGHATTYDLLGGRYADQVTDSIYNSVKPFPSYLQVSLGVARDLHAQPGYVTQLLDTPLTLQPGTDLSQISLRFDLRAAWKNSSHVFPAYLWFPTLGQIAAG